MATESGKRKYELKRRAESQARTRLRITEAAVDLHGTLGPARTSISAVAERAGVQRATLYRHFPDEAALFGACSAHWRAQHPRPDPGGWAGIADPRERLGTALTDLYEYYEGAEPMMVNLIRDEHTVPAMVPLMARFWGYLDAVRDALLAGRPERGRRRARLRAAIGHAVAFDTWRSLVRDHGLRPDEARELMLRLVDSAAD